MTLTSEAVQSSIKLTLQRKLDDNLYCLRLFAFRPYNGVV